MLFSKSKNLNEKLNSLGVRLWDEDKRVQTNPIDNNFAKIPTGSYALDRALGTGGWPGGKIIEIFGADSSGKSTLALHAIAEAQAENKTCVYIDLENTLNKVWAEKIGVKTDQLYICYPSNGEETFKVINSLVQGNEADLIVVDSVAAIVPGMELESSLEDQSMGLQARLMSKGLRILQSYLINSQTTVIFINQIREQIKQSFFPSTTTSGGRALKYAASIRVEVKRLEAIKQQDKTIGFLTKITIIKNKFNNPLIQLNLRLYFDSGFCKAYELINEALERKLLEKRGTWFYYKDKNIAQGLSALKKKLFSPEYNEQLQELKSSLGN
ncbi:recombinase RecA [Mycoplasma wenyonii]|uniref:Protein RecA n=1 Tax=Mycoplasma wenyonii TaxID=65123 RepID=A0A328PR34_9MOLU|nr:ATPase domain-containing protein [Mycoplasma wenyonii]RAO95328.1 recombinase RecA [Mycoplasma wenyonii]